MYEIAVRPEYFSTPRATVVRHVFECIARFHAWTGSASDEAIWLYARANGYTTVTKDADFGDLGVMRGYPPRIIWLRSGNCTTYQIELMLRTHHEEIDVLHRDPGVGVLTLIG
jgi:predicted nuclease of predicted toxin-antitoxin system